MLIFLKYVIYEIMPFLIGFAIAFLLQPLIRALARKSGGHERLWAVLTVIVFYMTIGAGIAILFYQRRAVRRRPVPASSCALSGIHTAAAAGR